MAIGHLFTTPYHSVKKKQKTNKTKGNTKQPKFI